MATHSEQSLETSQLLDAKYFQKWRTQHAPVLQQAIDRRGDIAQVAEAARFAKARSAIISGMMRWMREGYTEAEAACRLPFDSNNAAYWGYSYTDLLNVLAELGVRMPGLLDRSKGGDA